MAGLSIAILGSAGQWNFASTGTAMAQAATICDAAQFIVSDEPVENSLYFSSNSMSSTRVLRRYESHASYQVLASRIPRGADSCRGPVGLRRFPRFPTVEHDAQSGRSLLKGSRGLAGVQHAFVIHDLRIPRKHRMARMARTGWAERSETGAKRSERLSLPCSRSYGFAAPASNRR